MSRRCRSLEESQKHLYTHSNEHRDGILTISLAVTVMFIKKWRSLHSPKEMPTHASIPPLENEWHWRMFIACVYQPISREISVDRQKIKLN